jgi:hypothetical protein
LSKRTGLEERVLLEDMNRVKSPEVNKSSTPEVAGVVAKDEVQKNKSRRELIEERLAEISIWKGDLDEKSSELVLLKTEEAELIDHLSKDILRNTLNTLRIDLARAEASKDQSKVDALTIEVQKVIGEIRTLEERRKKL